MGLVALQCEISFTDRKISALTSICNRNDFRNLSMLISSETEHNKEYVAERKKFRAL